MNIVKRYSHGKYIMLHLDDGSRELEHRFVLAAHLGKRLSNTEVVHHKDGNGKNNNIFNLVLLNSAADHAKIHGLLRKEKFIKLKCYQCDTETTLLLRKHKYYIKKGIKRFCSRSCSGKYASEKYWHNSESSKGKKIGFDPTNLGSNPSSETNGILV